MAKSGRDHEGADRLVNELERLRAQSQRVRRQCDEAVESLREGWTSLEPFGKLENGLSKRGHSRTAGNKSKRRKSPHPHR